MKVTCLTSIRAIAVAVPFVMAGGLQANAATTLEELAVAAEAEGGTITWCNGSIPDTAMQGILEAFNAEYPNLRLEGVRSTSQIAYQRLHQDLQMGLANCDLFSSSDYSHFFELQGGGHLKEYYPERETELQAAFEGIYEPGYFYPGMVGTMVIAHSAAVDPDDAPQTWQDLLDPKWQDQLAVGHPGYSGYVATWALMMSQMYGLEYFEQLEALNPMIGRSATDAVNQLVSGERQVAIAPGQTVIRMSSEADLTMVFPEDGVLLMSSPVAIISTTERPAAAQFALEFMLGETYSRTVQQYGYESLNRNVAPLEGGVRLDEINTRRPSAESIQNDIGDIIEDWRDIFGG